MFLKQKKPSLGPVLNYRSKRTKKRTTTYVDYYQYLDVPVFSDRFWILRGFFEEEQTEKGIKKIFHWNKISKEYTILQEQIQKKNPYAVEPIINVGAWTFEPS